VVPHTQGAQAWITQCYLQLHQCLSLPRKHSPDGASPDWGCGHLIAAYRLSLLLIYWPRKDLRLSWPGWLTYSRWFVHISGHPSSAGRAQDRESSPVKDQCSTTVPRNQQSTACKQFRTTWELLAALIATVRPAQILCEFQSSALTCLDPCQSQRILHPSTPANRLLLSL